MNAETIATRTLVVENSVGTDGVEYTVVSKHGAKGKVSHSAIRTNDQSVLDTDCIEDRIQDNICFEDTVASTQCKSS